MKINKLYIIALTFLFIVSACTKIAEGMTGTKRSKSSDEFFVHKKKPLVLPPGFNDMPMPKPTPKQQAQDEDIEDLLGIKNQTQTQNDNDINAIEDLLKTKKNINSNTSQSASDKSLENSILKKINKN